MNSGIVSDKKPRISLPTPPHNQPPHLKNKCENYNSHCSLLLLLKRLSDILLQQSVSQVGVVVSVIVWIFYIR
jgi:hypothetical protein